MATGKETKPGWGAGGGGFQDAPPASTVMVCAGRPSVAADLARRRQRVSPPQDLAGLGVERGQAPADAEFTAGDAAIDNPVEIERRVGNPVTIVPGFDRGPPHLLSGLDVERDDIRVHLADARHSFAHRNPAVG